MLSMVNSSQRVANGSSGSASANADNGSMSGASVAHAIASLATSGGPVQGQKLGSMLTLHPQQFPTPMGDRKDNFDPTFNQTASRPGIPIAAPLISKKRSTKSKCSPGLRSGKWTPEEEAYTNTIIHFFKRGLLDVEDGTSLRWYLAKRLNCEAMRVTKKLKGNSSIGKQIFRAIENSPANRQAIRRAREELAIVEARFLESLASGNTSGAAMPMPSSLAMSVRGRKLLPNPNFQLSADGQAALAPMPNGLEPPPKKEDARLLLHFFSEAHDDEPEEEKKAEEGNLTVDLSDKLGKKRPLSSVFPSSNDKDSKDDKKEKANKAEEDAEPPVSKKQAVEIDNLTV